MEPRKPSRRKDAQSPPELSSKRKRLFFLITVSFPFASLVLLEIALRVFQYGPNLSLFITEEIAGKEYHIMNPDVKYRYFSRVEFSPNTSMDYFLVPKPAGKYRIFCLGASTTVGFPYGYAGSFSAFLRDRLRAVFPDRDVEIINLGMTATNSFTVLDIARELVDYEPDLLIDYGGHNEFYGALGIASYESSGSQRWLTELYLRLVHVRTFLLVRDLIAHVTGFFRSSPETDRHGTMMERLARGKYVPYRGETYNACLDIFKRNLAELKALAVRYRLPLIVSSQVSNLRDQAPFVSAVDTFRADLEYRRARVLDSLGNKQNARFAYRNARDYDELRFRASGDFNNALRDAADDTLVFFTDAERYLEANSPDSIVGNNLILEHLHPNAKGYFLIAKAYAQTMRERGLLAKPDAWRERDTVSDERLWQERSLTDLDELCAQRRIGILTSGWPFTEAGVPVDTFGESDSFGKIVSRMVHAELTWEQGHVAAAEYYQGRGEYARAEQEYRVLIRQSPYNVSPYLRLAQAYLAEGSQEDAVAVLRQSLSVEKTFFAGRVLGTVALNEKRPEKAIEYLEDAYARAGGIAERSEGGYLLALAYTRSGRNVQAINLLQQILRENPADAQSRRLLQFLQRR